MSPGIFRYLMTTAFSRGSVLLILMSSLATLCAQGVPTVQQNEFRSQWVGEKVDQIPLGGTITPLNGLGALVGSLQTPDEVQREVDSSISAVKTRSPFSLKPSLGVGWQISNQGATNAASSTGGGSTYSTASSPFVAPAAAVLYDRDHGPWSISAGYSIGYKYFSNQNYVANGSGSTRNPLSQTALFKAALEMSRYIISFLTTASSGTGYDTTSASFNRQSTVSVNGEAKYLLTQYTAVDGKAGYTLANSSGSIATPNNNTTALFSSLAYVDDVSDKTHLSAILGAGQSAQSLQGGTQAPGNSSLQNNQTAARNYAQALGKVKYDFSSKVSFDLSLGARYVTVSNITNAIDTGLKPAWAVGLSYSPTAKTSIAFSAGEQGADIVPEINLLLNWQPRQKTQVSLGVSQSESFANALSAQYLITRGFVGTINQQLFSNVSCILSGGYTTQTYTQLSGNTSSSTSSSSQLPSNYYYGTLSVIWKIRDWVNLANTFYYNTGQAILNANNTTTTTPQAYYTISLNFAL